MLFEMEYIIYIMPYGYSHVGNCGLFLSGPLCIVFRAGWETCATKFPSAPVTTYYYEKRVGNRHGHRDGNTLIHTPTRTETRTNTGTHTYTDIHTHKDTPGRGTGPGGTNP